MNHVQRRRDHTYDPRHVGQAEVRHGLSVRSYARRRPARHALHVKRFPGRRARAHAHEHVHGDGGISGQGELDASPRRGLEVQCAVVPVVRASFGSVDDAFMVLELTAVS